MQRPKSFLPLSVAMFVLAIAGFSFAFGLTRVPTDQLLALQLNASILIVASSLYGASAAAASIGLWRAAAWTPAAILGWGMILLLGQAALLRMTAAPLASFALSGLLFGAIVYLLHRHVQRQLHHRAAAI